jgi:CHAT domain-containing protein
MESRLELNEHLNAFYFLVQMEAFDAAARHLKVVEDQIGVDWWRSETRPWESLVRRAELRYGLNDDQSALEDVDQCIAILEATRAHLLRDTQRTALSSSSLVRRVYTVGIRSAHRLMKRGPHSWRQWLERTYSYAEAGKARALLDLLGSVDTGSAIATQPSWVRTWRELNARLTTLQALIAEEQARDRPRDTRLQDLASREGEVEERLQAFTGTMAAENPRFATILQSRSDVSSMTDVVEHIPGGSLLLQYHFADNEFFGWAMDSSGQVQPHHASHDARDIGREVRAFHAACSSGGDWQTAGQRLSRIFLGPFTKMLEHVERVIVVPFGYAHRLPFHALPWASSVFGDTHSVSVLPSGSMARHLQRPEQTESRSVLAIGDPANMSLSSAPGTQAKTLPPLPFSALEAWYIASLHIESRALVAENATMAKVRPAMTEHRLLHFATHGVLNERAPLSSAILLANGEALTVADLLGLGLNSDLVVLSGCRTGLGEVTAGDEVVGLTRALLASGAKATVVSLWPVLDAATSYLMRHFYEQLAETDPAGALKRAQTFLRKLTPQQHEHEREMLIHAVKDSESSESSDQKNATRDLLAAEAVSSEVDYSHPYFWAPFVYVGAA